ncbi:HNH endonuclease signature motif containing protein [Streptomyces chryseus]
MSRIPAAQRFAAKVNPHGPIPLIRGVLGRCHVWTGRPTEKGYGRFSLNGRPVRAHRYAVEQADGCPVPADLDVDHLCRNRLCVRRSHLEAVPHRINVLRSTNHVAARARVTHCPAGHAYDERNTYRAPNGTRKCRACKNAQARARRLATTTPATLERAA